MRVVKVGDFCFAIGALMLENIDHTTLVEKVVKSVDGVQFIDPEKIFDWDIFDAALVNAVFVYGTHKQKARSLANEVLLRLSATTQLEHAIERVGLREGVKKAIFFTVGSTEEEALELAGKIVHISGCRELELPDTRVEHKIDEVVRFYGLDDRQINAVQAESRHKAVKMLVMQKIASTIL
ncbi:MAG: KEOPS complex subunit Cgi121 [Candidatus Caldarchaeum sp.]